MVVVYINITILFPLCVCVYMYVCICTCVYIYVYLYNYTLGVFVCWVFGGGFLGGFSGVVVFFCFFFLTHLRKDCPKLKDCKVLSMKSQSIVSKAFSKSIVNNKPGMLLVLQ